VPIGANLIRLSSKALENCHPGVRRTKDLHFVRASKRKMQVLRPKYGLRMTAFDGDPANASSRNLALRGLVPAGRASKGRIAMTSQDRCQLSLSTAAIRIPTAAPVGAGIKISETRKPAERVPSSSPRRASRGKQRCQMLAEPRTGRHQEPSSREPKGIKRRVNQLKPNNNVAAIESLQIIAALPLHQSFVIIAAERN